MKIPKPTDLRVRRTRRLLREALLQLVIERGWDAVSVLDVCERAEVGRSTFYTHFGDKEALLLSGYEDLRQHLLAESVRNARDLSRPLAFLPGLIAHVEENRRMFRALVGKRAGQLAVANFRRFVFDMVRQELAGELGRIADFETAVRYISGGLSEMLIWFVDARPAPDTDELEASCFRFTKPVLAALQRTVR